MGPDESLAPQVEAVLQRRAKSNEAPVDADLAPVVKYLAPTFPTTSIGASSSKEAVKRSDVHWYCSNASNDLLKRAAVYLIFVFAYQAGPGKVWLEALETVLRGCDHCARGFGAARRTFRELYLSRFPDPVKASFFVVVDRWQAGFILSEWNVLKNQPGEHHLSALPSPCLQLLFGEPTPLGNVEVQHLIDDMIAQGPENKQPALATLGLTNLVASFLSSSDPVKRTWAIVQLQPASRRPLTFDEWRDNGIGNEISRLYTSNDPTTFTSRWEAIEAVLTNGVLDVQCVQKGLLEGDKRNPKGLMSVLSGLLGGESSDYPLLFRCFTALLAISPTSHIWVFDTSPELPHTLVSDIKNNPSFLTLLEASTSSDGAILLDSADATGEKAKGKLKASDDARNPLKWLTGYLLSLIDSAENGKVDKRDNKGSGFGEALAKIMNFCFSEMQHTRFSQALRAASAKAGFEAFIALEIQMQIDREDNFISSHISSATDIHASFITSVALRTKDYPDTAWDLARSAARDMLALFFRDDGRDIVESMLGLAQISTTERRRQRKKKSGKDERPAIRVEKLHRASIRKELWAMTYNATTPKDYHGAAILINAMATFATVEKLDRSGSWDYDGLKEVISEEQWISGIRAINTALQSSRENFARVVEAIGLQPDPEIVKLLWEQPDVARSLIILLLSPADEVHEPIISLIQQSYIDVVDERADCFRILLEKYPDQAMEGLCNFLSSFVLTANQTPESCSLAKWLVRCFTDVLDALCQPSKEFPALLQSENFLSNYKDGKPMSKRISDLWQLMTTSLAVIFRRTPEWAPFFDNNVMVDWMRDALIFGRQMAEHIRAFEAAALGHTSFTFSESPAESPVKVTSVGKKMVQRLNVVLKDLISWLRLTDVETLHQTFELIKTVVGRISKSNPDLTNDQDLESTLQELDKFCRKVTKSYTSRLSDDLLSELSDQLTAFNLGLADDEIQFVKSVPSKSSSRAPTAEGSSEPESTKSRPSISKPVTKPKNAFEEMMKSSRKSSGTPSSSKTITSTAKTTQQSGKSKDKAIDIDDFDIDDGFLDNFSARDLEIIEKKAKVSTGLPKLPEPSKRPVLPVQPRTAAAQKLNINLVPSRIPPKAAPSSGGGFKSKMLRDIRNDMKMQQLERKRAGEIGGMTKRLPAASNLGTGLGAHQPTRVVKPIDSGSSASESSDDEGGVAALIKKQKSPLKMARTVNAMERRPIKIMDDTVSAAILERERQRQRQLNMKKRLKPDITPLFRYVLGWNPSHTGTIAPHPPQSKIPPFSQILSAFPSAEKYQQVMLPLFLQELWAQCQKEQTTAPPLVVEIGAKSYEDDFLDIELSVTNTLPEQYMLHDSDIVILRLPDNSRQVFAKVQTFKRKFKDAVMKVRILAMMDPPGMHQKSKWVLQKHVSLSTALREFAALQGLPYYESGLLQDILAGRSATMPKLVDHSVQDAQKAYDVNEPQARAILGAMDVKGFALIQGPPGTGKTKTISGLVGKWMSDRKSMIARPGEQQKKAKLLVCAPSNAAIDEVCKRLMNGVPSSTGSRHLPSVVRLGADAAVNDAVKDLFIDNLVEARVSSESNRSGGGGEYDRIHQELEEVKVKIREKQDVLREIQSHDERYKMVENELHALSARRTQLGQASSKAKDAARDATRHLEGARRAARTKVLDEADIICATLSGAGQDTLAPYTFETVIIDEAAQSIEMSCLIPLKYGCQRCIMVGDPNQLPPTTFSTEAEKFQYNESLFVRMTKRTSANVQLLSIQYRMHPYISELPSKVFYNSQLKDGPDMAAKTKAVWHDRFEFGPYRFFNVAGVESRTGTSTRNIEEAQTAVELYRRLELDFGDRVNLALRVGIITMYREQLYEMKRAFNQAYGRDILQRIEFNTVDGFQGQEKDIIILSCVRSGPNLQSIGFLRDPRRMNVALTRAKSSLFIIGNGPTLERSDDKWRTIVGDARQRGFFIDYGTSTFAQRVSTAPVTAPTGPKGKPKEKAKIRKESSSTDVTKPTIIDPSAAQAMIPKNLAADLKRKPSTEMKTESPDKKPKVNEAPSTLTNAKPKTNPTTLPARIPPPIPRPGTIANGQTRPNPPPAINGSSSSHVNGNVPANGSYVRQLPKSAAPPPVRKAPEDVLFMKKKKKRPNAP